MVDTIVRACKDASGGGFEPVVRQEDIVRSALVLFRCLLLILYSELAWQRRRR